MPGLAQVAGPTSEVVAHGFARMTDMDIRVIVTCIRTAPSAHNGRESARFSWGEPAEDSMRLRGIRLTDGTDSARFYLGNYVAYLQMKGNGIPDGFYPLLFHNMKMGARHLRIWCKRSWSQASSGDVNVKMPPFTAQLSDAQIAALTYDLTQQFGKTASKVAPQEIAKLR